MGHVSEGDPAGLRNAGKQTEAVIRAVGGCEKDEGVNLIQVTLNKFDKTKRCE